MEPDTGRYFELPPPPKLAAYIECFWGQTPLGDAVPPQRVVPDGCADILFHQNGASSRLIAVGPMTEYADIARSAGDSFFGVRFRPGVWTNILRVTAPSLIDRQIALEDAWGSTASHLEQCLANAKCARSRMAAMIDALPPLADLTSLQLAVRMLEGSHGLASLDWVATQANMSTRQFRRSCLQATGYSPKLLARICRFRHAARQIEASKENCATVATECGFSDQSHLIAEFRHFSGKTPAGRR